MSFKPNLTGHDMKIDWDSIAVMVVTFTDTGETFVAHSEYQLVRMYQNTQGYDPASPKDFLILDNSGTWRMWGDDEKWVPLVRLTDDMLLSLCDDCDC